jgi:hypothetical protein
MGELCLACERELLDAADGPDRDAVLAAAVEDEPASI